MAVARLHVIYTFVILSYRKLWHIFRKTEIARLWYRVLKFKINNIKI